MITEPDIIIVGSGIVGGALACALGGSSLQVLILDNQATKTNFPPAQDLRVSAITYGCQQWLLQLGIWDHIPKEHIGLFRNMEIWDATAKLQLNSIDIDIPTFGFIVPNQLLIEAIHQRLSGFNNIHVIQPVTPESIFFTEKNVHILVKDQSIKTRLLVGADGAHSWVRHQCQFAIEETSYDHSALMAHIHHEKSHQDTAYQRFVEDNIIAFLPLADKTRSALVWSGNPEQIEVLKKTEAATFTAELQTIFGETLGALTLVTPRVDFPLIKRHAKHYIQDRVALIGDAAHTIHPLAGQGLNLGLWDAECLASVIQNAQTSMRDHGRYFVLRKFERERHAHNQALFHAVSTCKWLFSQTPTSLTTLRQCSLHILNHCSPLKNTLTTLATFGMA